MKIPTFLNPLIQMEQWCTSGLAEDDHSLLKKTSPPRIRRLFKLVFESVFGIRRI